MIKRYQKKPVVIEAIVYTGHNGHELRQWSNGAVIQSPVCEPTEDNPTGAYLQIKTLEDFKDTYHVASVGDYIIKGVKGEFYACKPDIFHMTYEDAV